MQLGIRLLELGSRIDEALDEAEKAKIPPDEAVEVVTELILDALFGEGECVAAGTPVWTADGKRAIERLAVGDLVRAINHKTGQWELCPVLSLLEHQQQGELFTLKIAGTTIQATGNHPFWVLGGVGLLSRPSPEHTDTYEADGRLPGRWVDTRDLRAGDYVLTAAGRPARIETITTRPITETVYNLEVAGLHNFAVGDAGVLVHNGNKTPKSSKATAKFGKKAARPPTKKAVAAQAGKRPWSPTYREAESDSHHIIQHAPASTGPQIPGRPAYSRSTAPATTLQGPSTTVGTEHYNATRVQDQLGGGNYGAERRIGYKALRRGGKTVEEARAEIARADRYFIDELGWNLQTPLGIPGNRR